MRRMVFLAFGSRGDVQPHVALAAALQARGHEVLVLGVDEYASIAAAAGVPYGSIGASIAAHAPFYGRWLRTAMAQSTTVSYLAVDRFLRRHAGSVAEAIDARVGEGDLVLSGVIALDSAMALRRVRGCDAVHVTFAATLPSAYAESICRPVFTSGRHRLNWLSTRYSQWDGSLAWSVHAGNRLRRRHGLRRRTPQAAGLEALTLPTLVAATPYLVPPAPDWPDHAVVTGPWIDPAPASEEPPAGLSEFLAAGPAPVYLGFGSMAAADPERDLHTYAEVSRRTGQRMVVRPNQFADLSHVAMPESVCCVPEASHAWLFPRCAAVIHHGGAGTTTAGLRAGVPTGIVAHNMDQPHNGRRVAAAGVGPPPLRSRGLNADKLTGLVTSLTTGPYAAGYRDRAAEVGASVRAECGIAAAIDALTALRLL